MKLLSDAFEQPLIDQILSELEVKIKQDCWRSSQLVWPSNVLKGQTGSCLTSFVSNEIKTQIVDYIKDVFPASRDFTIQFYVWQKGAGIPMHTDEMFTCGATLYLNTNWNINYGGTFIWEDKRTNELRAFNPTFNSLILNDEKENHLVTPVALDAPENRYTIQIWGLE